jgi:hypothetical protein
VRRGATTFHSINGGAERSLEPARKSAGRHGIRIAKGLDRPAATHLPYVRQ